MPGCHSSGIKNLHIVNQFIDEGLNRKNFVLDDVVSEDLLVCHKDKQIISDIQH